VAPQGTPAWLYKLAIQTKVALSYWLQAHRRNPRLAHKPVPWLAPALSRSR